MRRPARATGLYLTVVAWGAALALAGCDDDEELADAGARDAGVDAARVDAAAVDAAADGGSIDGGRADANLQAASVRVVHASPDAPAVDVYARGNATPLVRGLAYGSATEVLVLAPGSYDLDLRPAGAAATTAPAVTLMGATLTAGQTATVVAAGLLSAQGDDRLRLLLIDDGFAAGQTRLRLLHAAPDAPTVAIDLGAEGTADVPALARFTSTAAEGAAWPGGQDRRVAILVGTQTLTTFTVPALAAGTQGLVIATGLVNRTPREGDAFSLLFVPVGGAATWIRQDPTAYLLHASPDAPSVDLFVGMNQIAEGFSFGALTAPLQVSPGTYTIDVFPTAAGTTRPAGAPALSLPTPALARGERHLVIATGFLTPASNDEPTFRSLLVREEFARDPTRARVRLVHAAPDAPAVLIGPATGMMLSQTLVANLAFGTSSDPAGIPLDPTAGVLGLALPPGPATVARFMLRPTAGARTIAVAAGAFTPATGEQGFRLLLVETSTTPWTVSSEAPLP